MTNEHKKRINLENDFKKLCEINNVSTGHIRMNIVDELLLITVEYLDTYKACSSQEFVEWLCKKVKEYELDIEKAEIQIIPKEWLFKPKIKHYGKFYMIEKGEKE